MADQKVGSPKRVGQTAKSLCQTCFFPPMIRKTSAIKGIKKNKNDPVKKSPTMAKK